MITITRAQARLLRAVLRKCIPIGWPRKHRPPIAFHAKSDGLRVRFDLGDVAAEWHLEGSFAPDQLAIPGQALGDFDGNPASDVVLQLQGEHVTARWENAGAPQVREYPRIQLENRPSFPDESKKLAFLDPALLKALDDASQIAAQDNVRPALTRLQLRGKTGEIASTNSRQLLIQRGFAFPWSDNVLIPTIGVFGARELASAESVGIGRTDTHVCVVVGSWKFFLRIDDAATFPRIESAIPAQFTKGPSIHLAPQDAEFLLETLPGLPGHANPDGDITLDLDGRVAVRGRDDGQTPVTELVLNRSCSTGPNTTLVLQRQALARALQMGFREFHVKSPDMAIVARDRRRLFVWMPLSPDGAIPPSSNAIRIESAIDVQPIVPEPTPSRRITTMPSPTTNGHAPNGASPTNGDRAERALSIIDLIAEAEELRTVLADASARVSRLVSALKQQRRQSRAMQAAMHSLKQLQLDG